MTPALAKVDHLLRTGEDSLQSTDIDGIERISNII